MPSAKKCHRLFRRERALAMKAWDIERDILASCSSGRTDNLPYCARIGKRYQATRRRLMNAVKAGEAAGCRQGKRAVNNYWRTVIRESRRSRGTV